MRVPFYTNRRKGISSNGGDDEATHVMATRARAEVIRELLEDEEDPFAETTFPRAEVLSPA